MSEAVKSESYEVIWLIRRLFRALSQKSNESLEEFGIAVADRAVMEFLYPDKMLSVPEIAEQYKVSRQHIQTTVNSLLDAGFVATRDNPRHKRSPLIMLNSKGRELFGEILSKDEEIIEVLFSRISKSSIQVTQQTLQSLLNEVS
ncbi:MAG TPA: MarR family winged helix-turn-helix transcriptional regulator [Gammaproteobacteria bacterium]|nr:MarR family winged helix-turn-helix transcriptional regulator [Gammaproteobacteria bacterium]